MIENTHARMIEKMQARTPDAAEKEFHEASKKLWRLVATLASGLDPADPATLVFLVAKLLYVRVDAEALAEWADISRATVTRWGLGQNVPRAPKYRKWLVGEMIRRLELSLQQKTGSLSLAADAITARPIARNTSPLLAKHCRPKLISKTPRSPTASRK